jgi:hypothetical protein
MIFPQNKKWICAIQEIHVPQLLIMSLYKKLMYYTFANSVAKALLYQVFQILEI